MYSPQTNIRLLSTPLENDGANTLTWNSISAQTNYFLSKTVYSYADCTYQRKGSYIRIDRNIEDLYRCNYVMYRNKAYTDKWFYAFITDYEYVNDGVTYVYIEPDEIQTWYFELEFKDSFVVREHTNNDTIGANQTDEGLGLGAYVTNKKETMYTDDLEMSLLEPLNTQSTVGGVRITSANPIGWVSLVNGDTFRQAVGGGTHTLSGTPSQGGGIFMVDGVVKNPVLIGLTVNWDDITTTGALATIIVDSVDVTPIIRLNHNIIGYNMKRSPLTTAGLQQMTSNFHNLINRSLMDDVGGFFLTPAFPTDTGLAPVGVGVKKFKPVYTLDGYTPKNNKLHCYPFSIIKVHNGSDSSRVLQPELFQQTADGEYQFGYWSDKLPSCSVTATPVNYAGADFSIEYSINSAKYPLSSRAYDVFKNYLGIHRAEYNIQVASNLRSGALSIATGLTGTTGSSDIKTYTGTKTITRADGDKIKIAQRPSSRHTESHISPVGRIGSVVKGATEIASTLAEVNARQKEAFDTIGSVSNTNLNAIGELNIFIECQSVNSDYARRIDNYFSMYGYKTNLLKVPNITGRRNWNYVQTINANITADIPNDSLDTIRALLDSGVTFWHNPSTMYDYSQDNAIV